MKYVRHTSGAKLAVLMAVDVRRFLDEVPVVRRAALDRTLQELSEGGQVRNTQRFRKERGDVFAVKAPGVRVYGWFAEGKLFICGHGVFKKSQKADPKALDRTERLYQEYQRGEYELEEDGS